jgi:oxygen-independent coproporphyrinogen III oxidase
VHKATRAARTKRANTRARSGNGASASTRSATKQEAVLATATLRRTFNFAANAQIDVEIDSRSVTREMTLSLASAGVTRASLGVQDFEERVQKAVRRIQTFEQTAKVAGWLRAAGVRNINLDLMYGLPYQTVQSVAATARRALALGPERIALFGYAHVPWMKRHQRLLPEEALPSSIDRYEQYFAAAEVLTAAGYQTIGLDHFAKRNDPLAFRQREGRLRRNFQGYTTDESAALIGSAVRRSALCRKGMRRMPQVRSPTARRSKPAGCRQYVAAP